MNYLDATPLLSALRTTPEDFDLKGRYLRHIPSRHCFRFERDGHISVVADCDCAFLMVRPDQELELTECFHAWKISYWLPVQQHLKASRPLAPQPLRQALLRVTERVRSWLRHDSSADYPIEAR